MTMPDGVANVLALSRNIVSVATKLVSDLEAVAGRLHDEGLELVAIDVRDVVMRLSKMATEQLDVGSLSHDQKWQKVGELVGDHHVDLERVGTRMHEIGKVVAEAGLSPIDHLVADISVLRRLCHQISMVCVTTTQPIDIE